jgi:hypothetical protein
MDIMLLDNEMRRLLESKEVSRKLDLAPELYSNSNFDALDKRLDEIWENAATEHWDKLREVYGDERDSSFDSILDEYLQ